jgi:hypothetical protein
MVVFAHPLRLPALALALVAGLSACGNDTKQSTPAAPSTPERSTATEHGGAGGATSGSVQAVDQHSDGSKLVVAAVTLTGAPQGFIAVHQDLDGKPGPTVGVARLSRGNTKHLVVRLNKPVSGGAFWPMLHVDDHAIGTYEFPKVPGADLPVQSGGEVVMKKITLTVS